MRNITKLRNKKEIEVNEFLEFHSQLILNNIDVTDWTNDNIVSFRIGIHLTRTQRDWLIINVKYPGKNQLSKIEDWTCIDAFHQKNLRY
jgi:hypothetical protein